MNSKRWKEGDEKKGHERKRTSEEDTEREGEREGVRWCKLKRRGEIADHGMMWKNMVEDIRKVKEHAEYKNIWKEANKKKRKCQRVQFG